MLGLRPVRASNCWNAEFRTFVLEEGGLTHSTAPCLIGSPLYVGAGRNYSYRLARGQTFGKNTSS